MDDKKNSDSIKDSVNLGHTLDSDDALSPNKNTNPREALERELLNRLSQEKHRLAAELEIKFKEASIKRVKLQEQKFKELINHERKVLAQEKQKYEQALKEKYSKIMKTMLHEREKMLAEKIKHQHFADDVALRAQIDKLKHELAQQQQAFDLKLNETRLSAKHEQEKASRTLYDNIMQSNREEIIKQTEERITAEYERKEAQLRREHEINLKKHTAKLMTTYEEKLRQAVNEQEQLIAKNMNEKLTVQSELFSHRIKQEVDSAVMSATSKLELEHVKEKQALNAIIEGLKPEVEANRLRMRVEVEKELRAEFELKFAEYKQKIESAKHAELDALLAVEKQKLAEAMQQENMVVLKYKEREIREGCTAEFSKQLQAEIQKNLQEQEKRLRADFEQEFAQAQKRLQEDHALQLQAEVIQERARITDKATSEKKLLLDQQQINLQEQHASNLAHQLAMQAQTLNQQHQVQLQNLEAKIRELENRPIPMPAPVVEAKPSIEFKPTPVTMELEEPYLIPAPPTNDPAIFAAEKRAALEALEERLHTQFAQEMADARREWERESQNANQWDREQELQACEQRLRREFQQLLEQQRLQAAANFARQRDVELRGNLARYKQKLLNEMENARLNALSEVEANIKEQYATRMQQHAELARVEIERTKEQLQNEHNARVQEAVERQVEAVRREHELKINRYDELQTKKLEQLVDEERKKLHIKFAQDKANLIKELTAKFTREKHIAMNKYETELREKLYKEMVKQKDFIQTKFTQAQESALQEQKRRLEAQHRHEIERIKQGFFDPADAVKHDEVIASRNVEQLADRILSKFQK